MNVKTSGSRRSTRFGGAKFSHPGPARQAARIGREPAALGFALPGTLADRKARCGHTRCRCHADPPSCTAPSASGPARKRQDRHPHPDRRPSRRLQPLVRQPAFVVQWGKLRQSLFPVGWAVIQRQMPMERPSGRTLALGQAGSWLARLPVCDPVPALVQLVNDALRAHRQMDVHVCQALARVFEPDAPDAGKDPGHRDRGDRVLARRPGDEPGETKLHPKAFCPDVEAAQRPACDLPACVRLDSERSPRRRDRRLVGASVRGSRASRPLRARGSGIVGHGAKSRRERSQRRSRAGLAGCRSWIFGCLPLVLAGAGGVLVAPAPRLTSSAGDCCLPDGQAAWAAGGRPRYGSARSCRAAVAGRARPGRPR